MLWNNYQIVHRKKSTPFVLGCSQYITYHHASTMERVLVIFLGPSTLDGSFLSIQYQVSSKMVSSKTITYDCTPLH